MNKIEAANNEYENRKVAVFIPKSNNGDRSDVIVSVNGRTWSAQRGRQVMMPRFAARILLNSIRDEEKAQAYIACVTGE